MTPDTPDTSTTTPNPIDSIRALTIRNDEVTDEFLALLDEPARAICRPIKLGIGPDADGDALQLSYMGRITWREMLGGSVEEADRRTLETFADAVQHVVNLGLVSAIVTPAVRVAGAMASLDVRRFAGVHVIPAEGVDPSEVTRNFLAMLPPTTDPLVLTPAFDTIVHQVHPVEGDLVLLAFKDHIPQAQLRAFRRYLTDHSKREQERTGKTVHYLALDVDFDVHLFRPDDRELVKGALARAIAAEDAEDAAAERREATAVAAPTPILFNGVAVQTTAVLLDYDVALELFKVDHPAMDTGVLWTVTFKSGPPERLEGVLAPGDRAVPIVPGMKINVANTGSA
jgi:hypothetical protein